MSDIRVLLVDDEEEFVATLAERLALRGLTVATAVRGTQAVEQARERRFDAVLLDMAMPGLNGVETLKALREIDPDVQVIVLTGRATLAQAVEAMKGGALDLVEKPAPIEALVPRIEEAARRRASLEDRRIQGRIQDITHSRGW